MKISRRNFCLLMAGVCCTGVLAACGSSSSSTASSSAASASAAASGEVRDMPYLFVKSSVALNLS